MYFILYTVSVSEIIKVSNFQSNTMIREKNDVAKATFFPYLISNIAIIFVVI